MSSQKPADLAVSVHQRLLNLSKERVLDFNVILTQFALERLLYRLTKSESADQFVLKGAMLFSVWTGYSLRPTRDLDLLRYGETTQERMAEIFRQVCCVEVEPDGLAFNADSVRVRRDT